MVGWWPFDRDGSLAALVTNTPPLATDTFGGHDGLLCGNPRSMLGEVNGAYQGDGIFTSVTVPACPDLDVGRGRGFSIEGWINPANIPTNAAVASTTAYRVPPGTIGNQTLAGSDNQSLGMDFDVNSPIQITALG